MLKIHSFLWQPMRFEFGCSTERLVWCKYVSDCFPAVNKSIHSLQAHGALGHVSVSACRPIPSETQHWLCSEQVLAGISAYYRFPAERGNRYRQAYLTLSMHSTKRAHIPTPASVDSGHLDRA